MKIKMNAPAYLSVAMLLPLTIFIIGMVLLMVFFFTEFGTSYNVEQAWYDIIIFILFWLAVIKGTTLICYLIFLISYRIVIRKYIIFNDIGISLIMKDNIELEIKSKHIINIIYAKPKFYHWFFKSINDSTKLVIEYRDFEDDVIKKYETYVFPKVYKYLTDELKYQVSLKNIKWGLEFYYLP